MDKERKLELIRRRGDIDPETMALLLKCDSEAINALVADINKIDVLNRLNSRYYQENRYELSNLYEAHILYKDEMYRTIEPEK